MHELYTICNESKPKENYTDYRIEKVNVSKNFFRCGSGKVLMNLFWYVITYGKCYIYFCKDDDMQIHFTYVMRRCFKFPFLKGEDIHIGPCWTHENYRGKGIYPAVLYNVCTENKGDKYMIIDDKNISSQKGVYKAGFSKIGSLIKSRIFKIYRSAQNV